MASTSGEQEAFEEIALAGEVEGYTKQRVELVQRATGQWIRALRDLTARNNLLRYRDLKSGTLDFQGATDRAVAALLSGKTVRLSGLFPEPEARDAARRRLRTLHTKSRENLEERGVKTLTLACGLATWENKRATWEPRAPVLLRQAVLKPLGAAQDDFELSLIEEMELNPTLVHVLSTDFDCELDTDVLLDRVEGSIDELWELDAVYDSMAAQCSRAPGFRIEPRMVLANFAYTKLPMVTDLEASFDELVAHELIAAIAGDPEANEELRGAAPSPDSIPNPDTTPLSDEFLVLDADCSQNYAINAVVAGQNLIIKGPPGTGKSQTIANMISTLVARGKRVLFVTEKRAAIEAVLKRLHTNQIDELVLDLHGGVASRKAFIRAVADALEASASAARVDNGAEISVLEKRRTELNSHVRALHEPREPWGVSVYDARAHLLGLKDAENSVRFASDVLPRLTAGTKDELAEDLTEICRLGGIGFADSGNPWAHSPIAADEEARSSYEALEQLRRSSMPTALEALSDAAKQTGVPLATSVSEWEQKLDAWAEISHTLELYRPAIYEIDLEQAISDLGPAAEGSVKRVRASLFSSKYKAARALISSALNDGVRRSDQELLGDCATAVTQWERWRAVGGHSTPMSPEDVGGIAESYRDLVERVTAAESCTGQPGLLALEPGELQGHLDALLAQQQTLSILPRLRGLETRVSDAGLTDLMSHLHATRATERVAARSLDYSWYRSILDRVSLDDPHVGGFVAEKQDRVVDDFRAGDRKHIEVSAARIRRLCAETAVRTRDEQRDQEAIIRRQVALKRKHMPVRDLIVQTSDVLLSLKPCWAMSPLLVSQLLPAKQLFDVVVFDEASQVTPADAMPAILRGRQLVVAGDDHQLPPTAFFASENSAEEDEDELPGGVVGGTQDMESILDAVTPLLPFRTLQWHYRSQDERLIAFSNAYIYDRQLTTFPGVGDDEVIQYLQAQWDPQADTNSPSPEVELVVDLVFKSAESRPHESLGVIAMGIKHANRIEEACIRRLRENPQLEEQLGDFFAEDREERFFVKNLERVQGDERDAIILSVGYGKNQRGDLPYRFGPLLTDGGERRLNVAVTRAKRRITLVSSFGSAGMDPDRSKAEGVKLLRSYLQYAESGGTNLGEVIKDKPALNPFEVDVRDTLEQRGLRLTPQLGTSGYWIDYAVHHPDEPGRYVLAIECDGATYHSSQSARDRDRLRQEQLERVGWRFCRIWSGDWFHDKDKAAEKVLSAYHAALSADAQQPLPAEPAQDPGRAATGPPGISGEPHQEVERPNRQQGPRPGVRPGQPIDAYSRRQLVAVARWIESDDRLRTKDELLDVMIRELGFARRGRKIVAAVGAAIDEARRA